MKITLFSTESCPRCKILRDKMVAKNIDFEECHDEDYMVQLGIDMVPILKVEDKMLGFGEANTYINNL